MRIIRKKRNKVVDINSSDKEINKYIDKLRKQLPYDLCYPIPTSRYEVDMTLTYESPSALDLMRLSNEDLETYGEMAVFIDEMTRREEIKQKS